MRRACFSATLAVVAWVPLTAQLRPRATMADSTVPAIMARAGRYADNPSILVVLRNPQGRYTRAKQEAIADSLIERVTSSHASSERTSDTAAYRAAVGAMVTLAHAGMVRYTGMDADAGPPYPAALDGLIRIFTGSSVRRIRARALSLMLRQPDRRRGFDYVRQVAQASADEGYDATFALFQEASGAVAEYPITSVERAEALATLRELNDKHLVKNQTAAYELPQWIHSVKP